MTAEEIQNQAVEQILEIAKAAAIRSGARSVDYTTAEIVEGALCRMVATMVGPRGSQQRLREGIRMTIERIPKSIALMHFSLFGNLTNG